jgi:hypothetical protein
VRTSQSGGSFSHFIFSLVSCCIESASLEIKKPTARVIRPLYYSTRGWWR